MKNYSKYDTFLDTPQWIEFASILWVEIVNRWGEADYKDLTKRQEHLDTLKLEWDAGKYRRDRALAYPSIGDQLDMQYHDQLNGTTTWKDAIAKVKADNPKPTE